MSHMRNLKYILPGRDKNYEGTTFSLYLFIGTCLVTTARSLIHIFASDGGANSIAGIDIDVEGGTNLITIFALWGLEQLIISIISWIVIFKYRSLVPLMILFQLFDWLARIPIGLMKPMIIDSIPPGAVGGFIFPPLLLIILWFSLPRKD